MSKKLIFLISFVFLTAYGYAQESSALYDEFVIEMEDLESGEQNPQIERYKYATAESIIFAMIRENDMVGLRLLSKHKCGMRSIP